MSTANLRWRTNPCARGRTSPRQWRNRERRRWLYLWRSVYSLSDCRSVLRRPGPYRRRCRRIWPVVRELCV